MIAHAAPLFEVPSSTVPSVFANISESFADPGFKLVMVMVIGLPALFFIIKMILNLFPGYRASEDEDLPL